MKNRPSSNPGNQSAGEAAHDLITRLYPICRSITGNGLRETLRIIAEQIPLQIHEVPTGTAVFDWTVPREWNIRDAFVKKSNGELLIDFGDSSLHVVNYSTPFHGRMTLEELLPRLHSIPEKPAWIPYRTSYYAETWGFCLSHNQLSTILESVDLNDILEVRIDTTLREGTLTYGELEIPGASPDEVVFSTHCCHPSLCNDNLAGIAVCTHLARWLRDRENRLTYRFLFIPATIGSITWLAFNRSNLDRIRAGLVVACVGDAGPFHFKQSRAGTGLVDRVVQHVLQQSGIDFRIEPFSPYGYDERQYCSPGFNLPFGALMRTPHGRYPQYHTSGDNLEFVTAEELDKSTTMYKEVIEALEMNRTYLNLNPLCEPQLGRRGLYDSLGGVSHRKEMELAVLWVLNYSDLHHDLLSIAEMSGLSLESLATAAKILSDFGLVREATAEEH